MVVLLRTHNISFGWEIRKIILNNILLSRGMLHKWNYWQWNDISTVDIYSNLGQAWFTHFWKKNKCKCKKNESQFKKLQNINSPWIWCMLKFQWNHYLKYILEYWHVFINVVCRIIIIMRALFDKSVIAQYDNENFLIWNGLTHSKWIFGDFHLQSAATRKLYMSAFKKRD